MTESPANEVARELLPEFHPGTTPLLISIPHAGTAVPAGMQARLSEDAAGLPDTDWFVDRLYGFATRLGASMLVARTSRLVVDLNRPNDDQPLYDASQTQLMTGVIPMQCFSGAAVYLPGQEPTGAETAARLEHYWHPYHRQLQASLEHLRETHGYAVLLDGHSIRSQVPLLFDGTLPDLNLGSNGGRSAAAGLLQSTAAHLGSGRWSVVVDGRFKGGYITRHYGQPGQHIHALQLEIAQHCYMQEQAPSWETDRTKALQQHLKGLVELLIRWKPAHG